MPILIKDFSWSQTDTHVLLSVPLKNARARQRDIDLFVQPTFVKINAAPFLFECYLAHEIDAGSGSANPSAGDSEASTSIRILENEIRLRLRKATAGIEWTELHRSVAGAETVDAKRQIVATAHELAAAEDTRRNERRIEIRHKVIEKEIGRESRIREQVEAMQKRACSSEMQAVNELKAQAKQQVPRLLAIEPKKAEESAKFEAAKSLPKRLPAAIKPVASADDRQPLPAVRQCVAIDVAFSARRFPTPQRESLAHSEQEWLLKQDEARRAIGFVEEDLRPEERNVDWLKAKGADFYEKGNWLAAISAFSTAIRMNPKCYELYLNRASAQYKMENWNRCVTDCSTALDLLVPPCPSNLRARAQCMVKRGASLCKLGRLRNGCDELRSALRLQPDDEDIRRDLETAERALDEESD